MVKSLTVTKSNDIIDASYRLSLNEQRLILMCISQIKKGQAINEREPFIINAREFADEFKLSERDTYKELQMVAERLYERSATINNPDPTNPKLLCTKTRWISSIDYIPGEGELMISFAPKMVPYISLLEGRFTRYSLDAISGMKSTYAIRFYELFKKWSSETGTEKNIKEISIGDLKKILDIESKYKIVRDLRIKVLNPAIQDINTYSDLSASYIQQKRGRRITGFTFKFFYKNQINLPLTKGKPQKITEAQIIKHAQPGESYAQVKKRLSQTRR